MLSDFSGRHVQWRHWGPTSAVVACELHPSQPLATPRQMRARITHTLTYRYSAPVLLEPIASAMKPRALGFQRLLAFLIWPPRPDPHGLPIR